MYLRMIYLKYSLVRASAAAAAQLFATFFRADILFRDPDGSFSSPSCFHFIISGMKQKNIKL